MGLSTPSVRRRKKLALKAISVAVCLALLLLFFVAPVVALALCGAVASSAFCLHHRNNHYALRLLLLLSIILVLGALCIALMPSSSGEGDHPVGRPSKSNRVRGHRAVMVLCTLWLLAMVGIIVGPSTLVQMAGRLLSLPEQTFGLVDTETYHQQCVATTQVELEKLREHISTHGVPEGVSNRAHSRLESFTDGFMGVTRREALLWLVRAIHSDAESFSNARELNDGGFVIGADGRRVDLAEADDEVSTESDDMDDVSGANLVAEQEDEAATFSNLQRLRHRVFG
mmetsp:Transcript_50211/g.112815  ORF Transcript_50211/g.112815 Transcript_50211/m.112815 type:complete len:285 (-) Transcript_50211:216-1070(-)|eukprot:CAMPEP_0181186246 /NCGR_PEP_ID=MMETSP1096-20121128/9933_1 /TAXON_ID=156174 ORGANISM="Chrysochromulina ericina, Strain CCMP281" /NCGR_SAMPLE_ID=MMETSP1096 /ASSEMBLY_ACC=CAM_ASM_000453 /LENGTH=284 /DNA_ID=CAMNT_0023275133 /DNA_START=172 /DNA_END=1026 /DNA_ORIENTATION=-